MEIEKLDKKYNSLLESYRTLIKKEASKYKQREIATLLDTSYSRIVFAMKTDNLAALRNLANKMKEKGML